MNCTSRTEAPPSEQENDDETEYGEEDENQSYIDDEI